MRVKYPSQEIAYSDPKTLSTEQFDPDPIPILSYGSFIPFRAKSGLTGVM